MVPPADTHTRTPPIPLVECPSCGGDYRVRPESLGRKVVCTTCGSPFVAETALPGLPGGDPLSYGPGAPGPWAAALALALLAGAAALAAWMLAHR